MPKQRECVLPKLTLKFIFFWSKTYNTSCAPRNPSSLSPPTYFFRFSPDCRGGKINCFSIRTFDSSQLSNWSNRSTLDCLKLGFED
jgi:hypothetical protein